MQYLKLGFALTLLGALSCTDAQCGKVTALGNSAMVTCFSGGKLIYEGTSTGLVKSPENSDGWQFKDAKTHALIEVSGDCVITVGGT